MVMGSLAVSDRALATRSSKARAVEVGAAPPQPVWLNACIRYRVSCLCVFEGVPGFPLLKSNWQHGFWIDWCETIADSAGGAGLLGRDKCRNVWCSVVTAHGTCRTRR